MCFAGFSLERNENTTSAVGQAIPPITAVPVQLGRESYGVAMIDSQAQTLWLYEFNTRGQTFDQLRLIAARSFEYDRQLTEWNTGAPTPSQVKQLVESLKTQRQQQTERKQEKSVDELQQLLEQE